MTLTSRHEVPQLVLVKGPIRRAVSGQCVHDALIGPTMHVLLTCAHHVTIVGDDWNLEDVVFRCGVCRLLEQHPSHSVME